MNISKRKTQNPKSFVIWIFSSIFICLLCALMTGCSSDRRDINTIRLGYLQSDLHHLPVFVALEKGFFQQEGITVDIVGAFRAGPELMSAFAAHELDIGYVGMAPAITAVANNTAQVKLVAQVNVEGSALVVDAASPHARLSDLKGKIISIPGHATVQDFLIRKALKNEGMAHDAVNILVLKPPEMLSALSKDDIHGFIAWEPYPSQAVIKKEGKILIASHDIWENHPCCVVVADAEYFKRQPGMVDKIRRIHQRSCEFISKNQSEAVAIGVKYTGMGKETVALALENIKYDGQLDDQKAAEYVDFLRELRYIKPDSPEKLIADFFR